MSQEGTGKVQISEFAFESKLCQTAVVPITSIQFDVTKEDLGLVKQLRASIEAPWGKLLSPVVVSKLPQPNGEKVWLLRDGVNRVLAFQKLDLDSVTAVIVEGTDHQIALLVAEHKLIRRHMNQYQLIQEFAEWGKLIQFVHTEYTAGGNKQQKADGKAQKKLPDWKKLVEAHSGMSYSTFQGKVSIYNGLEPTVVKPFLAQHPNCPTIRKERTLRELSKYKPEEQKELVQYLKKLKPTDAYLEKVRAEAAEAGAKLPIDVVFPIYHEPFWENAKRIAPGSVHLIATDPNWVLAEDSEDGEMWSKHGIPIAPQLSPKRWLQFAEEAALNMHIDGHAVIMVGAFSSLEIDNILSKVLKRRGKMTYLLLSGGGNIARKTGMATHTRDILVYRHPDAKPKGQYQKFIHDVVPKVPMYSEEQLQSESMKPFVHHQGENEGWIVSQAFDILPLLKAERVELDARIAELEAGGDDPYTDDLIATLHRKTELMKRYHPWAQDVAAWREIIRRFTKAGDFVWDPFAGSGTTGVAAITCTDHVLGTDHKWHWVNAPRVGMGCDIMEKWAKVANFRIWQAQQEE